MVDVVKKAMLAGIGALSVTREKVEELVDDLIKKGELGKEDRAKFVRELVEKAEARSREAKKWVDERIKVAVTKIKPAREEEVAKLSEQVSDLTKTIARLERKLREQGKKGK